MQASPEVVYLDASTSGEFENTFYNATVVTNVGPLALHGLTSAHTGAENLDVAVMFGSLANILKSGNAVNVDIVIKSDGPLKASFTIIINTLNGTDLFIPVYITIKQFLPVFMVDPPSLNARINRGASKNFDFIVTNIGTVPATTVNVALPLALSSFISLISFGNEDQPEGDLRLGNEESAVLSILVKTSPDQQFGELSGTVLISAEEAYINIPFSIVISSDTNMNLTVIVEDEYSYFAASKPLVDGAVVRVINYQQKTDLTLVTKNGMVTFLNISEDQYELFVDGPNHQILKQVIVTDFNDPIITVFISRNAVTYTWSVTPVTFQDTYKISLEADFETHVPIPVVTVTPTEIDLEALELELINSFQLNVTNHGLIRADNVRINLPDHPFLHFTTTAETLGDLEALSSVIVGVHVTRKTAKRAIQTKIVSIAYAVNILYQFVCGDLIEKLFTVQLLKREYRFDEVSPVLHTYTSRCNSGCGGSGGDSGSIAIGDGGSVRTIGGSRGRTIGGGSGGSVRGSFTPISASTPVFCNKCLQTAISCIPSLLFPKVELFPGAPCISLAASEVNALNAPITFSRLLGYVPCAVELAKKISKTFGRRLVGAGEVIGLGKCLLDAVDNCVQPYFGKRSLKSKMPTVIEGIYTANLSTTLMIEIFGSDLWINIPADTDWFNYILYPTLDDASDDGIIISEAELLVIQSASLPNGTTADDVTKLIQRFNNTFYGWNHGQLEPQINDTYNMISYSNYNDLNAEIIFYNDRAKSNGYESFLHAYNSAVDDVNSIEEIESESGVCAVVRIRIEQELAITREAFLAKLDIENNENLPLENVRVEILINDASNGENSTSLFSIGNATLSGSLVIMDNIDNWILPSGESGAAEWLIVPYSEAAPTSDYIYDIGGTLMYMLGDEEIIVPLLPTKVIVTPDPSLHVHYFWEKYVIGDNPFTEDKEPSVPFSLAVAVSNVGYGTAFNMQITSAQPEIIENEKGLLVNFKIIGNTIGSEEFAPSLTVNFGDLASNRTVIARWWMLSSLQGKFMNYSATFENVNPLGDPKLSVVDELDIHELIKSVYIDRLDEDDGILDFLVNDKKDLHSYPDAVYSSKDLKYYPVNEGQVISVSQIGSSGSLSVRTYANNTGWTYFIYEDTTGSLLEASHAAGLNTTKQTVNNDESVSIPVENSWRTVNQQTGEQFDQKTYLHIFDFIEETGEITYTVNSCDDDECPVDVRVYEPFNPVPVVSSPVLSSTTIGPTPILYPDEAVRNSIMVVLYDINLDSFKAEYEERFRIVTANITNEYCLRNICENTLSQKMTSKNKRSDGIISPLDVIIDQASIVEDGNRLTFLFHVLRKGQVLNQETLLSAIKEKGDEYEKAGFNIIEFSIANIIASSFMPSPTDETMPSPTDETMPSPTDETMSSPTDETIPSLTDETMPSLTDETMSSPTDETMSSLTDETIPSPIDETMSSPTDETMPSPTDETMPSPTDETMPSLFSSNRRLILIAVGACLAGVIIFFLFAYFVAIICHWKRKYYTKHHGIAIINPIYTQKNKNT